MTLKKIWLSSPHLEGNEQKYVQEAFDSNWISTEGFHLADLENDLENYLGQNCFVGALSSGTAAIHLGLILLGVKAGDEVICQSIKRSRHRPIRYCILAPFPFLLTVNPIPGIFVQRHSKQLFWTESKKAQNPKPL